jgi:hypothetical protein
VCEGEGDWYLHGRIDDEGRIEAYETNDLNSVPLFNSHKCEHDLKHAVEMLAPKTDEWKETYAARM